MLFKDIHCIKRSDDWRKGARLTLVGSNSKGNTVEVDFDLDALSPVDLVYVAECFTVEVVKQRDEANSLLKGLRESSGV